METIIKSTEQITTLDGVLCRHWEGTTDKGVRCNVFIHRIAVHKDDDASAFEAELKEMIPPGRYIPLNMIL